VVTRNRRFAGPKRANQWVISHNESLIGAAGAPVIVEDLTADYETALGRIQTNTTVTAIRAYFGATASATPPTANGFVSIGIGFVNTNVTAAEIPDPLNDDFDWLFHSILPVVQGLATGDYAWGKGTEPLEINNRSQRKLRQAFSKLVVVARQDSNQNLNIVYGGRTLWKLP